MPANLEEQSLEEDNQQFLRTKPTAFTRNQLHRVGKALRHGQSYDSGVLDAFVTHNAQICDELTRIAQDTLNCLLVPFSENENGLLRINSRSYYLSSRPKTHQRLAEKLRRMPSYPLENITDVAGARFDCDMTLGEQTELTRLFAQDFENAGCTKVLVKDMRKDPHSGYRAVHLHLDSPAGKAEFQIRTAMQAQWANMYEVAADVYGRSIRYLEFGEEVSPDARESIESLHEASRLIGKIEELEDQFAMPFSPTRGQSPDFRLINPLKAQMCAIIDQQYDKLNQIRNQNL